MIKIQFYDSAWEDILWYVPNNPKLLTKVFSLVESIIKTPFSGLGKPEALKGNLKGYWSRRITDEHRLVYKVENEIVYILFAKGHYLDK